MQILKKIFPPTAKRVQINTSEEVNDKINKETMDNILNYTYKSKDEIATRMLELNEEWDIERVLATNIATSIILTTILGTVVNKKWHWATGMVGGFLLQYALQGWCPPVEILRRLGVRTFSEINLEKEYLKSLL